MSFLEGIVQFFCADCMNSGIRRISVGFLAKSMSTASCNNPEFNDSCRNDSAALVLKALAISSILVAGVAGISIPLLGRQRRHLRADSNLFVIAKAFAAGVILATGFVHMLSDGAAALSSSCLPSWPWSKFPFSGFFAMLASLCTLIVDFIGTQYYEKKNYSSRQNEGVEIPDGSMPSDHPISVPVECSRNGKLFGEEAGGGMHIVGIHAHAAHHRHSHPHGEHSCDNHSHLYELGRGDEAGGVRHVVVSQVLELGIVSHSVIIGLSLGVSHSPCTVRPLLGALSFHQFFEGFALGGCISEAQFNTLSAALMALFFAITTPAGIAIGMCVSSFYNGNSARALAIEGTLDSISAGILVYMALVDLIAADFLSKKMRCNPSLQVASYFALFLGAISMSSLAIWA